MTYSTTSKGSENLPNLVPTFPLFAHATGRWAKKIRGKLHYFGKWADPDAALQRYVEERDDLYAGRKPRRKGEGLTVKDLVNKFLLAKKARVDAGELALGTFGDQYKTCKRVLSVFGGDRLVDDLAADDFETLRAQIAKTYGKLSRKVEIKRVRSIFRYAYEANLIEKPVRFGPGFVGPSRRELRCERQQNGERMFEAAEIRAMLAAAPVPLKAMILLGINCGFGNTDVANLTVKNLDLKGGWCNYPRPKTGISRRCPLWPETVKAIRAALKARPEPQDKADADLVFLTPNGQRWVWSRGNIGGHRHDEHRKPGTRVPCGPGDGRHGAVAQQTRACPPGPYVLCPSAYVRDNRWRVLRPGGGGCHHGTLTRRHGQRVPRADWR